MYLASTKKTIPNETLSTSRQIEKLSKIMGRFLTPRNSRLLIYAIPTITTILTILVKQKALPKDVGTFIKYSHYIQILIFILVYFATQNTQNINSIKTDEKGNKIKLSSLAFFITMLIIVANISNKICLFISKAAFDYNILLNLNLFDVQSNSLARNVFNKSYVEELNYTVEKAINDIFHKFKSPLKFLQQIPYIIHLSMIGSHQEYFFRDYLPLIIQMLMDGLTPVVSDMIDKIEELQSTTDKDINFYLSLFTVLTCSICLSLMKITKSLTEQPILCQLFVALSVGVVLRFIRIYHGLHYALMAHFMFNALNALTNKSLIRVVFWKWNPKGGSTRKNERRYKITKKKNTSMLIRKSMKK